jgi:hypothetical protein
MIVTISCPAFSFPSLGAVANGTAARHHVFLVPDPLFAGLAKADNKKAASGFGRLAVVLSMDMTGQGRAKRTHHQLPLLFIEIVMARIVSRSFPAVQANLLRQTGVFLPFRCDQIRLLRVAPFARQ